MDPLSQLFAAYMQMITSSITDHYTDALNTNITSQSINYQGTNIRFQHFLWKVKPETVCIDLKQQATQYSHCTQQAKAMFTEICSELSGKRHLSAKAQSLTRMYCNASASYQPMIASIGEPKPITATQMQEKECNRLILKAMQDNSPEVAAQKEKVCALVR
ncbi:hypothetical protein L2725_04695 [Shewanella corallii]|uniref:Uncharacterized protein n=1 Tax=Shewanella corallii TaxID=560080 RepID=A0ABT0N3Q1_9GAMM|nr:hypothetical protein [Shewanella corallii]MCL2913083.1 hypothetical protein [Shewanella corallii]